MTDIMFRKGFKTAIRPVFESDIQHCVRWMNDQEITEFLGHNLPAMEQHEKKWFEKLSGKKNMIVFTITTLEGKPIGMMGLHDINHKDQTAETGAFIGEKEYLGKGYGTDAKMQVLYFAFTELNLRKVTSQAFAFNSRSIAYLKKTGYQVEGTRKKQVFRKNRFVDQVLLAVFKKDFMRIWKRYQKQQ